MQNTANRLVGQAAPAGAMRAFEVEPHEQGSMRAFFSLQLPSGLVIRRCSLHFSGGRFWVSVPHRRSRDAGGVVWTPLLDFRDRATRDRFMRQATEAALEAMLERRAAGVL